MNPTIVVRPTSPGSDLWHGYIFWLRRDLSFVAYCRRNEAIESICNNLPNAKFEPGTAASQYPQDAYHAQRPVSLAYPVMVDSAGQCWAIDEAVSVQHAHDAIAMARCSGAIATVESELTGPNTERVLARVHRLDDNGRRVRGA